MNETFDIVRQLLIKDRSVRRFDNSAGIEPEVLESLIELTRYCASGRNLQPLKYRSVYEREKCAEVYPHLKWAGYLPDWDGPQENERPAAYIIQCLDTGLTRSLLCDDGLQLQAITLGATALGLGGCIIKSFNVQAIKEICGLPEGMEPIYIYALGRPAEEVALEDTDGSKEADIKYYRTPDAVHHVPKRPLGELLI